MPDGRLDARAFADIGRPERMNPGLGDLLRRAGRLESLVGRDVDALRLHALAGLFEGGQSAFLVEEAEIASRGGRSDEALDLLLESARIRPDWARARAALGYELSRRGRALEAIEHLREAVRLEPRWADVQYQFGLLLHAAGRNEDAMRAMETALGINPSYIVARIALANLLFDTRRAADAAPHFERIFEEGMNTPFLAGRFGYALHAAGDRNRAEELFLDSIAKDRNRAELLALYGQFLAETDRRLEARTVWDRALATNPPDRIRAEIETMRAEVSVEERRNDA
jgi:tetratricopeptide (TPR) repeat protein